MAQQNISQGRPPIVWSTVDEAFQKINANFTELYFSIGGTGVDLSNIAASLIPDSDELRDLGSPARKWKDLYLSGSSLYLGSSIITANLNGSVNLPAGSKVGESLIIDPGKNFFSTIIVPGQSSVDAGNFPSAINFVGSGINLTTNPATNTVTFTNNGVITASAGIGISVSGTNPLTITNTGVTGISGTAGQIGVSAATGSVTLTNLGVTQLITDPGSGITLSGTTGVIQITNAAPNIAQDVFKNISVFGQGTLVPTGPNSTLNITSGNGISLSVNTTPSLETLTITNSGVTAISVDGSISASSSTGSISLTLPPIISRNINGDLTGSVFSDGSTMVIDGTEGKIVGPISSSDGVNSIIMDPVSGLQIVSTGLIDIQGAAGAQVGIGAGTSGDLYLGNGSNDIIIVSGSDLLISVDDLVVSGGDAGQVLSTDGAGGLSWIDPPSGGGGGSGGGDFDFNVAADDSVLRKINPGETVRFVGTNGITTSSDAEGTITIDGSDIESFDFSVAADDSTLRKISSGESIKFIGTNGVTTASDTEGNITISAAGVSGLASRTTPSGSTGNIADAATANVTVTGFKGYLLYKIQTSAAAWVRIYTSVAARTADSGRSEGVDPSPGAGVIAEVITTGAETVLITPGTIGFNDESSPTTNIELAVTNKSGGSADITVTLTVVKVEE